MAACSSSSGVARSALLRTAKEAEKRRSSRMTLQARSSQYFSGEKTYKTRPAALRMVRAAARLEVAKLSRSGVSMRILKRSSGRLWVTSRAEAVSSAGSSLAGMA